MLLRTACRSAQRRPPAAPYRPRPRRARRQSRRSARATRPPRARPPPRPPPPPPGAGRPPVPQPPAAQTRDPSFFQPRRALERVFALLALWRRHSRAAAARWRQQAAGLRQPPEWQVHCHADKSRRVDRKGALGASCPACSARRRGPRACEAALAAGAAAAESASRTGCGSAAAAAPAAAAANCAPASRPPCAARPRHGAARSLGRPR